METAFNVRVVSGTSAKCIHRCVLVRSQPHPLPLPFSLPPARQDMGGVGERKKKRKGEEGREKESEEEGERGRA